MSRADLISDQHMSRRAKVYLMVAAARHLVIGAICVLDPNAYPHARRGTPCTD